GNYLDLADLPYAGNSAPSYSATGTNTGTLAVTEGTNTIDVTVLGSYSANSFVASSDGHGGTLLEDPPVSQPEATVSAGATFDVGSWLSDLSLNEFASDRTSPRDAFSTSFDRLQVMPTQDLATERNLSQLVQAMASHVDDRGFMPAPDLTSIRQDS